MKTASTPPPGTVLVVNPSADLYGSDRMVLEGVRGLIARGHKVVFTCSDEGPLVSEVHDAGATVEVLPAPVVRKAMLSPRGLLGLIGDVARKLPRMRKLVRETKPEVVLVNTVSNPFWNAAARLAGAPVVVYVHEAEGEINAALRKLLLAPLNIATGAIYNSETSRRVSGVASLKRRNRTRIVYNGVGGPNEVVAPREVLDSPLRVVFVGRLSPRKGPDLLIEAAAILRDQGFAFELEIVGDIFPGYEWYEDQLRNRIAELDLASHVNLAGFRPSVWSAIARSDVMVVPSRFDESFGNVVIEGVLSARPVLVAEHSGLREASAGLTSSIRIQPDSAESIANGLVEVQDRWEELREAAMVDAAFAAQRYSVASFQSRLVEAIRELGAARTAPAPVS